MIGEESASTCEGNHDHDIKTEIKKNLTRMEEIEQNMEEAVQLANQLYLVVRQDAFRSIDEETRMKVVHEKYPTFARAYPAVVKWMVIRFKYSERAFRSYLKKIRLEFDKKYENNDQGFLAYIKNQADYAVLLYKSLAKRWSAKIANKIWADEYDQMYRVYKDIKDKEKKAKNEFEEEKQKHLEEKVDEIFDFIKSHRTEEATGLTEGTKKHIEEYFASSSSEEDEEKEDPLAGLSLEEIQNKINKQLLLIGRLEDEIRYRNERIEELEIKEAERSAEKAKLLEDAKNEGWLPEHLRPGHGRNKKSGGKKSRGKKSGAKKNKSNKSNKSKKTKKY